MSQKLIGFLEVVLGQSKKTSGNNRNFYCPKCNHYKRKLEINVEPTSDGKNPFHCWVCGLKGTTIYSLLVNLGRNTDELVAKLNSILATDASAFKKLYQSKQHYTKSALTLPKEFIPLYKHQNTIEYKQALHYVLKKRKIPLQHIIKYNLGYCESGPYKGMVIIPSYNKDNELNFFTGRSFFNENFKHKNPDDSKDVIGFENQINWSLPVILTEGAFDAITIRRNVIPLFGKLVLDNLKWKILEEGVKQLYIVLDPDAIRNAIKTVEYFIGNGVQVHLVDLGDKDPNELGYEAVNDIILSTPPCDFTTLTKYKILSL